MDFVKKKGGAVTAGGEHLTNGLLILMKEITQQGLLLRVSKGKNNRAPLSHHFCAVTKLNN